MAEDERDLIEGVDEDGNRQVLRVNRYFYYNGDEYVLLSDDIDEPCADPEKTAFFVMRVRVTKDETGEEIEEFEAVEQELMDALIETIRANYNAEEDVSLS